MRTFHNSAQDAGDFVDRPVMDGSGLGTKARQISPFQQFLDRRGDLMRAPYHEPQMLFQNPLRVIAFLRERPGVAFDDDWQPHGHCFADASRPGLAHKEIGEGHVERHLVGKAFHQGSQTAAAAAQGVRQLGVASTDEDELEMVGALGIQTLGDFEHGARTLPAEQHQPRGQIGIKPALLPLRAPVALDGLIKARVQDHARGLKNPAVGRCPGRAPAPRHGPNRR